MLEGAKIPSQRPRVRAFIKRYATQSQAALVDTDCGEYVIKAMNNRDGPPVLIAEWVGSMAARWLGVDIPDFAIVELNDVVDVRLDDDEREVAAPGPCFGSKLIEAAGWNGDAGALEAVENQSMIPAIVALDTWLINLDRFCRNADGTARFNNPGNLLLGTKDAGKGKFRIVAIDFGYALGGPLWNARRLSAIGTIRDDTIYGCFPVFQPYMQRHWVEAMTARLREFDEDVARSFLADVPSEWGLSSSAGDAVVEFLKRRAGHTAEKFDDMIHEDDRLWGAEDQV